MGEQMYMYVIVNLITGMTPMCANINDLLVNIISFKNVYRTEV